MEWLELSRTLAQLCERHPIQLNALQRLDFFTEDSKSTRDRMQGLLPEITKRGVVEFIPEVATHVPFAKFLLMSVISSNPQ